MTDYPEFASFLHNPWGYPTKVEQAAITAAQRYYRFVGGCDINSDILNTINKFFKLIVICI